MSRRQVLFACHLDSQVFGALPLAHAFAARGWAATFAVEGLSTLPAALRERLADGFSVIDAPIGGRAIDSYGYDAVGVYATGSRIARFRRDFELAARVLAGPRPALFSGFNGVVFEKFEEGLAWRLGCDFICLNGPRDRDAFLDFASRTPFADQPVAIVGLRRTAAEASRGPKPPPEPGARKLLVFAEQVAVPSDPLHRAELVAALARLARTSPGWDVVLKARVRPDEQTFHQPAGAVEKLLARLPAAPPNLKLSYEPLDALLGRADLFGTVSSTALFDAFDHGVPSFVVADFGVRNGYGSQVMFGSGLMVRLADLTNLDAIPRRAPDSRWLDRIGYGARHAPDALIDLLERFDPSRPLPPAFQSLEPSGPAPLPLPPVGAHAIAAARAAVEAALAGGGLEEAAAALRRLGEVLDRSDIQHGHDVAWIRTEGPVAGLFRKLGIYWMYKRVRTRLLGAAPR